MEIRPAVVIVVAIITIVVTVADMKEAAAAAAAHTIAIMNLAVTANQMHHANHFGHAKTVVVPNGQENVWVRQKVYHLVVSVVQRIVAVAVVHVVLYDARHVLVSFVAAMYEFVADMCPLDHQPVKPVHEEQK